MVAAVKVFISLLLVLHSSRGQKPSEDSVLSSLVTLISVSPQSIVSFLLLALTVLLSGTVYLWILRYVCHGCCDPVAVGVESEALAVVV
ncbi:unnamed protein product [Pleuronectes platessa]|uniref:Uncharacterized protein n=1 Tax=Pleuronectes platessa TaxID=8262 RepID=A0A9N7TQA1_PLEPL|nr:unnamed protein product [Pleuronectes platessa]